MWPDLTRVALVFAVAWFLPGYLLCRAAGGPDRRPWLEVTALSFTLGLGWLLVPAVGLLALGAPVGWMRPVVVAMDAALLAFVLVRAWTTRRPPSPGTADPEPAPRASLSLVLALPALASLLALAFRASRVRHFTFAGDEWVLMQIIRHFLEAPRIVDTFTLDAWGFVLAFLTRTSGVDLLDLYGAYLPLILVVAACGSFLFLARVVLDSLDMACFAFALQTLYCLADMQRRGEGAGMALLVRVVEDKYFCVMVIVPVAQALFLRWLRGGAPRDLALFGASLMTGLLVHPLTLPWLGLTCGPVGLVALWRRRELPSKAAILGLATLLAAALGIAWWIRSIREPEFFAFNNPAWPYGQMLLALNRGQLIVLSLQKGWYMGDPVLLRHPLMIAALVSGLILLHFFRRSLAVPFVVLGTWVPVAVVFNPLTATLIGHVISPWMVYRLLWVIPVSLTLACLVQQLGEAWTSRGPALVERRRGLFALACVGMLAVAGLLLAPRIGESWEAARGRNRIPVRGKEREVLAATARLVTPGGRVIAPGHLSIELPVWTSRLKPLPGLEAYRSGNTELVENCRQFYEASVVDPVLLQRLSVGYVIVEAESLLERSILERPVLFKPLFRGSKFVLYAFRAERFDQGAPPVSQQLLLAPGLDGAAPAVDE